MALNFHIPGVPFKLTAADMGVPDITKSLTAGIKNAYLPQRQAAELLKMQLANQFQRPRAQRANEFAAAELQQKQAEPSLTLAQAREIVSRASEQEYYNNLLYGNNGGNRNPPRNNHQFNGQQNNNPDRGYDQSGGNQQPISPDEATEIVNNRPDHMGANVNDNGQQNVTDPNLLPENERQIGDFTVKNKEYLNKDRMLELPNSAEMARLKNFGEPLTFGRFSTIPGKMAEKAMSPVDKNAMERSNQRIIKEQGLADIDGQNAAVMLNNATESKRLLDKLLNDSEKLRPYQKGMGIGLFLPVGTEAQKFDADNQSYLATVSNDFSGPDKSPTDATRYAASMSKTSRSHTPEARSDLLMFRYGGAQRQQEIAQMNQYLIQEGYSQKVRNRLIGEYNKQRSFWNTKDGIDGLNTPFINTWKDFVTPEAVYAADRGRSFTPKNQKELESMIPDREAFNRLVEEEKKYPAKERKFNNYEEAKAFLRHERLL